MKVLHTTWSYIGELLFRFLIFTLFGEGPEDHKHGGF